MSIGLAIVLAACGSPPGSGSGSERSEAPSLTAGDAGATHEFPWQGKVGADRENALLEAAKAEAPLLVYSAYNDEQKMADAFMAKYGLEVDVYNANSESVLQRMTQEAGAGKVVNDVLIAPSPDMEVVTGQEVLGTYESEYRDKVSDLGKGAQWTGVRRLAFVVGWNKDRVASADLPNDFDGFTDPKWKGRLSMELSDIDWYFALGQYYAKKGVDEKGLEELFGTIAGYSDIVKGHTAQGELLAAGQFDVAMSLYSQSVDRAAKKGAPITYGDAGPHVAPVVVRYDAGGIMKDTDSPAAANLYLDFQLSEGGFAVDREVGSLPPIAAKDDPIAGAEIVELDVPAFVRARAEVAATYDAILKRGSR